MINERNKQKNKSKRTTAGKIIAFILSLISVICVIGAIIIPVGAYYIKKHMMPEVPDVSALDLSASSGETRLYVYDFTDRVNRIGEVRELEDEKLHGAGTCIPVTYSQLPADLVNAFIAIEDKRFFSHNGVDYLRTAEAGVNYLLHYTDNFGASTITQQLIKNATGDNEVTPERKIREMFAAEQLEEIADKTQIFEAYANLINLSAGCRGVGAAAQRYFGKTVGELTLAECASIAAITNNPGYYNPSDHPDNNLVRRNLILSEMKEQGYITDEEYITASDSPVDTSAGIKPEPERSNSWYTDMVISDVIRDLCEQKGWSRAEASAYVYGGSLRIYTAQDERIQKTLDSFYADKSNFPVGENGAPQSAMIVIDPHTGDILGVAGAVGDKNGNRICNFATDALHPAGSCVKPVSVYAPALEGGIIKWSSIYDDTPVKFIGSGEKISRIWPKNSDGIYRGLTDIDTAVSQSVNTVAVKVLGDLGIDNSFAFMHDTLEMKSLIESKKDNTGVISDKNPAALALGQFSRGVTVREITAAYSIFEEGIYRRPRSYFRVTDSAGNIILSSDYEEKTVLSRGNAAVMTKLLENVVEKGTAHGIGLNSSVECAGKTGTTQNNCDRWYIGYTPELLAGVWLGYEYPKPLDGIRGNPCVGIWDKVLSEISDYYKGSTEFNVPGNVVRASYCKDSGDVPGNACAADVRSGRCAEGWFVSGTEPRKKCSRHILVSYDIINGGVATEFCPVDSLVRVGMLSLDGLQREFPVQIYVTDAQYMWKRLPYGISPTMSDKFPFFAGTAHEKKYYALSPGIRQFNRYCNCANEPHDPDEGYEDE